MKIQTIKVSNYKAISEQEIELNGSSAMITAGNNKGKTSLLRGLIDRFHGERPEFIVKQGEEKGLNTMTLTDGSIIEWRFTNKTEVFTFTTKDGIKQTTSVLSTIGKRYFGDKFDIDKFIGSSQKQQVNQVQSLLGLNMEKLDSDYKEKFALRTDVNRDLKRLSLNVVEKPEVVELDDIEILKAEKTKIEKHNEKLNEEYSTKNEKHQQEIFKFNNEQNELLKTRSEFTENWDILKGYIDTKFEKYIDFEGIKKEYESLKKPSEQKEISSLTKPELKSLTEINEKIESYYESKSEFDNYNFKLEAYNKWVKEGTKAKKDSEKLTKELDDLNSKRMKMIQESKLPEGFEMTTDGLFYKGLPLDDNQISSSAKYVCALKLGATCLGEIKSLHFDASFLDKNTLNEIQKWASENDLQLLIERPDFEAGEIKYNFI